MIENFVEEDKKTLLQDILLKFPARDPLTTRAYEQKIQNTIESVYLSFQSHIQRGIQLLRMQSEEIVPTGSMSLQSCYEVSDSEMEAFFICAEQFLENERFEDAIDVLYVLIGLDPLVPELWMRLGDANFFNKQYRPAIQAYSLAATLLGADPRPYAYMAHCYKALKEYDAALEMCNALTEILYLQPELKETWQESVNALKIELQQSKGAK